MSNYLSLDEKEQVYLAPVFGNYPYVYVHSSTTYLALLRYLYILQAPSSAGDAARYTCARNNTANVKGAEIRGPCVLQQVI